MKTIFATALIILASIASSNAQNYGSNPSNHNVQGYETNRGTYVAPHHQTNPNNTQYDNYSSQGNVNPYTVQPGTRTPRY